MKLVDVFEMAKDRKKGQQRMDLFRRENLDTWLLFFPPGNVQRMHSHPSDRTMRCSTGRGLMKALTKPTNCHQAKSSASRHTNTTKDRIPKS